MRIVDHPFIKFDQLKPIYNFTYPLFRTISNEFYGYIDFSDLKRCDQIPDAKTISLYIHVPFCETICSFCPFQKGAYKHIDQIEAYVSALARELLTKSSFVAALGGQIRSIYVGGGTPSILTAENIRHLGKILNDNFDLTHLAEFTLESEAKSVTEEKLCAAAEIGINRISFGVQTFTERFRSLLNLTATRENIENTVMWSQTIIGSVGFDILCGMHGQKTEEFLYDLKCATDLKPETLNLYPINNIAITPKLHKAYALNSMKPSSLSHRQLLRLFGDIFIRDSGYAPCNGHSYIKGTDKMPLNKAAMSSANSFCYHKYLHGYHDDYVVGFGASAQSILGSLVTRANPNRTDYITSISKYGRPKCHYNWVPKSQIASKPISMRLPYNGYIAKDHVLWEDVDPFVLERLQDCLQAGLITETEKEFQLTRSGWQWYSSLTYYLLPIEDRTIIDQYVFDVMEAPLVLDGATEVFAAA